MYLDIYFWWQLKGDTATISSNNIESESFTFIPTRYNREDI